MTATTGRRWPRKPRRVSLFLVVVVIVGTLSHYGSVAYGPIVVSPGALAPNSESTRGVPNRLFDMVRQQLDQDVFLDSSVATSTLQVDQRPHAQRASGPRTARRMNHAFRYLYRHNDQLNRWQDIRNLTGREFLVDHAGYTEDQVDEMILEFPPLLELSVRRHLWPKLRFLRSTLGLDCLCNVNMPPQYFGARLERTIAPRHAFLMHHGLPHGKILFNTRSLLSSDKNSTLWHDVLLSSRNPKHFCALCNSLRRLSTETSGNPIARITPKQIEAFDVLFQRGLMPAARDELCQHNNTWPLDYVDVSAGAMIRLLIAHGANPLERDARGSSLLHWACGTGNLGGVKELLPYFRDGVWTQAERDGAMPLHWAAAGAAAREFGCGGHVSVCMYLLDQVSSGDERQRVVNQRTKDGNSALMWAAWSGTLDVVKLMVRNRADAMVSNRNGCTVAHWASSGGNIEVCRYLAETVGVDFSQPNQGGNTPLTHAVAFGRVDVVEWLRNSIVAGCDDRAAAALAKDFVGWSGGDSNRRQVLSLFEEWFGSETRSDVEPENTIDSM